MGVEALAAVDERGLITVDGRDRPQRRARRPPALRRGRARLDVGDARARGAAAARRGGRAARRPLAAGRAARRLLAARRGPAGARRARRAGRAARRSWRATATSAPGSRASRARPARARRAALLLGRAEACATTSRPPRRRWPSWRARSRTAGSRSSTSSCARPSCSGGCAASATRSPWSSAAALVAGAGVGAAGRAAAPLPRLPRRGAAGVAGAHGEPGRRPAPGSAAAAADGDDPRREPLLQRPRSRGARACACGCRPAIPLRDVQEEVTLDVCGLVGVDTGEDLAELERWLLADVRDGVRANDHTAAALTAMNLAVLRMMAGRFARGRPLGRRGRRHLERRDTFNFLPLAHATVAIVANELGDTERAEAAMAPCRAAQDGRKPHATEWYWFGHAEAAAQAAAGDPPAAQRTLLETAERIDGLPDLRRAADLRGAAPRRPPGLVAERLAALGGRCDAPLVEAYVAHAAARAAGDGAALARGRREAGGDRRDAVRLRGGRPRGRRVRRRRAGGLGAPRRGPLPRAARRRGGRAAAGDRRSPASRPPGSPHARPSSSSSPRAGSRTRRSPSGSCSRSAPSRRTSTGRCRSWASPTAATSDAGARQAAIQRNWYGASTSASPSSRSGRPSGTAAAATSSPSRCCADQRGRHALLVRAEARRAGAAARRRGSARRRRRGRCPSTPARRCPARASPAWPAGPRSAGAARPTARPRSCRARAAAPRPPSPSAGGASSGCPRVVRVVAPARGRCAGRARRPCRSAAARRARTRRRGGAGARRTASSSATGSPRSSAASSPASEAAVPRGPRLARRFVALEARAAGERAGEVARVEVGEEAAVQVRVIADGGRVLRPDRPADVVVAADVGDPAGARRRRPACRRARGS